MIKFAIASIHPYFLLLIQIRVWEELEPIPSATWQEAGYNVDRTLVCFRGNTERDNHSCTNSQLQQTSNHQLTEPLASHWSVGVLGSRRWGESNTNIKTKATAYIQIEDLLAVIYYIIWYHITKHLLYDDFSFGLNLGGLPTTKLLLEECIMCARLHGIRYKK